MVRLNVPIALLSVALSTSAWFILYGQNLATTRSIFVNLSEANLTGLPNKLYVDSINRQEKFRIALSGPTGDVNAALDDPAGFARHITIDMSNATIGEKSYDVNYDRTIQPIVTGSNTIQVKVERIIDKSVQIKVVTKGQLQDASSSLRLPPPMSVTSTTIHGPESEINGISYARAWLDLGEIDVNSPGKMEATLTPVDAKDQPVQDADLTVDPPKVEITPIIDAAQVDKTVIVSANIVGAPAPGYVARRYSINPQQIQLTGPSSILVNTSKVETEKVDVTGLTATQDFPVRITTPRGTSTSKTTAHVIFVVEKDKTIKPAGPTNTNTTVPQNPPPKATGGKTTP